MKLGSGLLAVLAGICMSAAPVFAQSGDASHAREHADAALASMHLEHDPFAAVHIVMSRKSYDGMPDLVRNPVAKADTAGTALIVSEIKAHRLSEIAERIHQREQRCGGFFAFATRA